MAPSGDALARDPVSPAPSQRESMPRLELLQLRPVRRKRPVAILKIPRLWPAMPAGRMPAAATARTLRSSDAEGLDVFGSEAEPTPQVVVVPPPKVAGERKTPTFTWLPAAAKWTAVVVLSAAAALASMFEYQRRFAPRVTTGTITVETSPSGLDVALAGKPLGKTPLTTSLAPGTYELQVGTAPTQRLVKVNVAAGLSVVQHVEFADPVAAPTTGGLRVQTEPAHLAVFVDGTAHGVSPVSIDQLQPGEHEVSVKTATGVVRRAVTIQSRETISLIVSSTAPPADAAGVSAGWIAVSSPIGLQLREGGKVIGTSESERLMLTAGDHDIEFANDALGFSVHRTVHVTSGKTTPTKVDLPNGALSINAQPWAEVWIDGERVGETPIGNLSRRIGTHEVVFKHPDLGERHETVVISVGKPARIGVDLRKK
jgi:hypothetical protein